MSFLFKINPCCYKNEVSISSPSGEGGEVFRFGQELDSSPTIIDVSISSPSGEGGELYYSMATWNNRDVSISSPSGEGGEFF